MLGVLVRCACGWVGDCGECDHRITGEHCPRCDKPTGPNDTPRPQGKPNPALVAWLLENNP